MCFARIVPEICTSFGSYALGSSRRVQIGHPVWMSTATPTGRDWPEASWSGSNGPRSRPQKFETCPRWGATILRFARQNLIFGAVTGLRKTNRQHLLLAPNGQFNSKANWPPQGPARHQKLRRADTWAVRGARALETTPKSATPRVKPGILKIAWLSRL